MLFAGNILDGVFHGFAGGGGADVESGVGHFAFHRGVAFEVPAGTTILEALLDDGLPIDVVVVDRPCRAEKVAAAAGVPSVLVLREDFSKRFDRDAFTAKVVAALEPYHPELVAMAGYGTILAQGVHDAYPGRILNTHPALLPAFKGWHAVEEALAAALG